MVIQAYLRDSEKGRIANLIDWAKARPHPVTVRLVKGAYWDYETVIAKQMGWRVPVFEEKPQTDANFELLAAMIMENHDKVRLACASHNLRSIACVSGKHPPAGHTPKDEIEFQVLFGMSEPVLAALQPGTGSLDGFTPRWENSYQAWPIWSAAFWRTRPMSLFCAGPMRTACPWRS